MKPPKLFLRPNIMRVSPWAALFLVVLLFAVAHHIIVGKTTQLTGYIVAATPKQRIEHEKGGIVQEILVQQGDHVKAGQLLIRLDPTATQQTLRYMQAGRLAQHLRRVRLEALSAEATPDETASYAPKRQESATPPAEHTFIHHQAQLLHAQQRARKQQEQLLTLTIDALQTEIDALAGQETFFEARVRLAQEHQKQLLDEERERHLPPDAHTQAKQQINTAQSDYLRNRGLLAKTRKAHQAAVLMRQYQQTRHTAETLHALGEVMDDLNNRDEAIAETLKHLKRLEVRAPVSGTILAMPVTATGHTLAPGALIATILPDGTTYQLEVSIDADTIRHISLGQRVTAYIPTHGTAQLTEAGGTLTALFPVLSPNNIVQRYQGRVQFHPGTTLPQQSTQNGTLLVGTPCRVEMHTTASSSWFSAP